MKSKTKVSIIQKKEHIGKDIIINEFPTEIRKMKTEPKSIYIVNWR